MSEKKLLFSVTIDDCTVYTFTVKGPGGSGKDTSNTGVRVVHPDSGGAGVCVKHRSQHKNKIEAFKRMRQSPEFKRWHLKMVQEKLTGQTVEQMVEEAMQPSNIKTEVRLPTGWSDVSQVVNCVCHAGSVCNEACLTTHHDGCSKAHTAGE